MGYYPFGLKQKGYNTDIQGGNSLAQQWKYNGIELNEDLSLNLYEMEVRQYDPAIARWTGNDPVIHFDYSPYHAFDNNPVFWADPSGANAGLANAANQHSGRGNGVSQTIDPIDAPKKAKRKEAPSEVPADSNESKEGALTSTYVDRTGKIIDHIDDGDDGIYLVLNPENDRKLKKSWRIGTESPFKIYEVGSLLNISDLDPEYRHRRSTLPSEFKTDYLAQIIYTEPQSLEFWPMALMSGGGGAWRTTRYMGYFAKFKLLFNGGTAKITVSILGKVDDGANFMKMIRGLEAEAKSNGAKKLLIEGIDILNTKLVNTKIFERLGYTIENVTDTTIKISKKL